MSKRARKAGVSVAASPAPQASVTRSEPKAMRALWLAAMALTAWSFGFTTMMGSDLWWHIASGRWIVQNRTLNFRDPWSFTRAGQPWISHEWFSDVVYWTWSRLFGMESLVWWKWTVIAAAFCLLFSSLRKLSQSSLAAYLACLVALAVGAPFLDVRPHLYSLLGFAIVLRLALLPSRARWLLPAVFLVWVNLHGGFFFGLLALTVVFAVARLSGDRAALGRNALPLWLGCTVACLVNPGGPDAFAFSLHYALNPKSAYLRIGEWKPPWQSGGIESPLFFPCLALFAAAVAVTLLWRLHRQRPHLTFTGLALALLTLAMALKSRRFIPLFGMAQALVLAPLLAALGERIQRRFLQTPKPWARALPYLLPVLALGLGAVRLWPYPLSRNAFLYLTSLDNFPVEAMNVIEANSLAGKVFSYYEWGGYVDLRTDGRLRVFIDGRADTVFDDDLLRRYTRVLNTGKGWERIVEDSGAEFFLWPRRLRAQTEKLRESGEWRTIYSDHVATLLARDTVHDSGPLEPSPDSPWRQLALGWSASGAKNLADAEKHFGLALQQMPNLRSACEWLANTQARDGRLAEAEVTLDRCQRSFPDSSRKQELLQHFRARAESMP